MKNTNRIKGLGEHLAFSLVLLLAPPTGAAGLLEPVGGGSPLEIREHHVRVIVDEGYVTTEVEQVFHNAGGMDLEAVYSFPVPHRGAVAEFSYWIDGVPVTGEVLPADQARQVYEEEIAAGRETALAVQDGYQDIELSVWPVRAQSDVRIRLVYHQPVEMELGIGRYVYPLEDGGTEAEQLAFFTGDDAVSEDFSFTMELKSGYPIDAVRMPGQPTAIAQQLGAGHWRMGITSHGGRTTTGDTLELMQTAVPSRPAPASSDQDAPDVGVLQTLLGLGIVNYAYQRAGGAGVDALSNYLLGDAGAYVAGCELTLLTISTLAQSGQCEGHPAGALDGTSQHGATVSASAPADVPLAREILREEIAARLDQDVVIYWRLQPGLPGSVDLVTHRAPGQQRGTFLLTITPGDDLQPITRGRDWIFVLDTSGSMDGKLATLAHGVQRALEALRTGDRFRIYTFADGARELTSGWQPATRQEVALWSRDVSNLQAGGQTDLYAGLQRAIRSLDGDRTSAVVLVSDGEANAGVTAREAFLDLIAEQDLRLFTVVMGNSANVPLLESMAEVSDGFAIQLSNSDDIAGRLLQATAMVSHEALHGVEIEIDGVQVGDLVPAHLGAVYRGEQMILMGHYWGSGKARVSVRGSISGQPREYSTVVEMPAADSANPELERLWAFASIQGLVDRMDYYGEDADTEQAITDLAVEYGLVTDHTAMVVVREEIFDALGIDRRNATRVSGERKARDERSQLDPVDRRADRAQPMYQTPRAQPRRSDGGGLGAMGLTELLLAAVVVVVCVSLRRMKEQRDGRASADPDAAGLIPVALLGLLLLGASAGAAEPRFSVQDREPAGAWPTSPTADDQPRTYAADFDGDGRQDLATWSDDRFQVQPRLTDGSSGSAVPGPSTPPLDSDAVDHLVAPLGLRYRRFDHNPEGEYEGSVLHALRDMDGDAIPDLVTWTLEGGGLIGMRSTLAVYAGSRAADGQLAFTDHPTTTIGNEGLTFGIELVDPDGDGQVDVLMTHMRIRFFPMVGALVKSLFSDHSTRKLSVYPMRDGRYPEDPAQRLDLLTHMPGDSGEVSVHFPPMAVGDIDGDGREDLLLGRDQDALLIHRGTEGDALFAEDPIRIAVEVPAAEDGFRLEDVDGDGVLDLIMLIALAEPPRETVVSLHPTGEGP